MVTPLRSLWFRVAAWTAGADRIDALLYQPTRLVTLPQLDTRQLVEMRHFAVSRIRDITQAAAESIRDDLSLVMIGTQTPFEAVQSVTDTLTETVRRRATMIVRTDLATAYSIAGQGRMSAWGQIVPGLKKRWLASGKVNPRLNHAVIDGQEQPFDQPFILGGGLIKMMHPHDLDAPIEERINCGCLSVPVVPGYTSTAKPR